MGSLREIKEQALEYDDWVQFGSKLGDPYLSIFSDEIKKGIAAIEYKLGESYFFDDGEFNFKISVEEDNGAARFNLFIKPKKLEPIETKEEKKLYLGMTPSIFLMVTTISFLLIVLVIVWPALMKAFFGV